MAARRQRRLVTLDDFLAAAKETARRIREDNIDVERLIEKLAESAAMRAAEHAAARCREPDKIAELVAREVAKTLGAQLGELVRALEALGSEVSRLREELRSVNEKLARIEAAGRVDTQRNRDPQLPAWAKRLLRLLDNTPYVKLHEAGVDPRVVRSSLSILERLDAVLVETSTGVYLVKSGEWRRLLQRLSAIKQRDEEEALRAAGELAEVVEALLRDNMLYFNNGWRVLRDAVLEPPRPGLGSSTGA